MDIKDIKVENPSEEELEEMSVRDWPIWEKKVSEFDWHYDSKEICYLLEGKVEIEKDDDSIEISAGDLVTFPEGLDCYWKIKEDVKKHYKLE